MPTPYIDVKNISYTYQSPAGEVNAIKNLSFQVYPGEFLAIVGPSGCGKSTLLSILSRLITPKDGTIKVTNPDGSIHYPKIGYMLQNDCLFEWRTIFKNVLLGLEIQNKCTKENMIYAEKLLDEYGLLAFRDKKPSELSGGMKQRVALIRTLVMNPELLLLDEPFSALDYQTRLSVSGDIAKIIREKGKTAILITHDLSEAISLADRILVLSKRPAKVVESIPIHLTKEADTVLAARKAPEFASYFNHLWEVLANESK